MSNPIHGPQVASCTNEVLSKGGTPLFFLDYFATGKLQSHVACDLVKGMAFSCKETGCALVGLCVFTCMDV